MSQKMSNRIFLRRRKKCHTDNNISMRNQISTGLLDSSLNLLSSLLVITFIDLYPLIAGTALLRIAFNECRIHS